MNIFIITLEDRQDRIEKIKEHYKNVDFKFFFGAELDQLLNSKKKITTKFCNTFCTLPMVGCASSHILLWEYIHQNYKSNENIIILEDDCFLEIESLKKFYQNAEHLFKLNKKLFLRLVGEGVLTKSEIKIKNYLLKEYRFGFFLGGYILNGYVAGLLYNFFKKDLINYHIDFMLNKAFKKLHIQSYILQNKIGQQYGQLDSNMSKKYKLLSIDNNPKLTYSLTFPIIQVFGLVINFYLIIVLLLLCLCYFIKNPFYFLILGILLADVVFL